MRSFNVARQTAPAADLVAVRDSGGKTALHYCVENTNTEPVELLISYDRTLIDVRDDLGHSALHLAAVAGNEHVVKCLLQNGADINTRDKDEHSIVHWATGLYLRSIIDMFISRFLFLLIVESFIVLSQLLFTTFVHHAMNASDVGHTLYRDSTN